MRLLSPSGLSVDKKFPELRSLIFTRSTFITLEKKNKHNMVNEAQVNIKLFNSPFNSEFERKGIPWN